MVARVTPNMASMFVSDVSCILFFMGESRLVIMNLPKKLNFKRIVTRVIATSIIRSDTLSTITVPSSDSKGRFSLLLRTPHRVTSPTLGSARLAKYPIITAPIVFISLGRLPSGSISSCHLNDLITCDAIPTRSDSITQKKFASRKPFRINLRSTSLKAKKSNTPESERNIKKLRYFLIL